MIEVLNWISNNGWTAFWIGMFIIMAIEEIGRALKRK